MIGDIEEMIFDQTDITTKPTYWLNTFPRSGAGGSIYRVESESWSPDEVLERARELGFTLSDAPDSGIRGRRDYLTFTNGERVARMTSDDDYIGHPHSIEYEGHDLSEALLLAREMGYKPSAFTTIHPNGYRFREGCGMMKLTNGTQKAGIWFKPSDDRVKVLLRVEPWSERATLYRLWMRAYWVQDSARETQE